MAEEATLRIYRGDNQSGQMVDYKIPVAPGMVVLDAVHAVQATHSPDLAVRWNCKAGKCGSCSAEVNGKPRLLCMDRMDKYAPGEPITIRPMKSFPVVKDLACDVSWNYEVNKKIPPFKMRQTNGEPKFSQEDAPALDADGNVVGGLRLPPIDVPVATYVAHTCHLMGA